FGPPPLGLPMPDMPEAIFCPAAMPAPAPRPPARAGIIPPLLGDGALLVSMNLSTRLVTTSSRACSTALRARRRASVMTMMRIEDRSVTATTAMPLSAALPKSPSPDISEDIGPATMPVLEIRSSETHWYMNSVTMISRIIAPVYTTTLLIAAIAPRVANGIAATRPNVRLIAPNSMPKAYQKPSSTMQPSTVTALCQYMNFAGPVPTWETIMWFSRRVPALALFEEYITIELLSKLVLR